MPDDQRRPTAASWVLAALATLAPSCWSGPPRPAAGGDTGASAPDAPGAVTGEAGMEARATASDARVATADGRPPADAGAAVHRVGINPEPSMRPWRYLGPNPDSWWDPTSGKGFVDAEMTLAANLGVAIVRVEFPWWVMEPATKGSYDWSRADYIVASAASHHLTLAPIIVYTPAWAAATPNDPPSAADYSAFVRALAGRYPGVLYWEMWNEPNLPQYWSGSEQQYVNDILVPGAAAVRAANPAAKVIAGGPAGADTSWITALYTDGGKGSFDVMAFHDYTAAGAVVSDAASVRSALRAQGDGTMPIWLGEFGQQESGTSDPGQQSLLTGVVGSANPLAATLWYNIRDDEVWQGPPLTVLKTESYGLVLHDDTTLKQGYTTLKNLIASGGVGAVTP